MLTKSLTILAIVLSTAVVGTNADVAGEALMQLKVASDAHEVSGIADNGSSELFLYDHSPLIESLNSNEDEEYQLEVISPPGPTDNSSSL